MELEYTPIELTLTLADWNALDDQTYSSHQTTDDVVSRIVAEWCANERRKRRTPRLKQVTRHTPDIKDER